MFEFRRQLLRDIEAAALLTPLEIAEQPELWRELFGRPLDTAVTRVRPFRCREVAPGVPLFSAGTGAPTLIVGFAGKRHRLMLPTPQVLQQLEDSQYDLLLLRDPLQTHFERGMQGIGDTLHALCSRIAAIAEGRGYRDIITYGTSMGGLVALRAGPLLGAARSISAGGRFAWDIGRFERGEGPASGFDLLCACRSEQAREAYALFSDGVVEDVEAVERLRHVLPAVHAVGLPVQTHNFVHRLSKSPRLAKYHRHIFDLTRPLDAARLRRLFD